MTSPLVQHSEFSRVWIIPFTAGPANVPEYEGLARAMEANWDQGDVSAIYIPDPDRYGEFLVVGTTQEARSLPTLPVEFRYKADSEAALTRLVRNHCEHDLQVHMGECQDPQDFNFGWTKVLVVPRAKPSGWSTNELGALVPGDRTFVNETIPFVGQDVYEILRIVLEEQAESEVVQEVIDILVCDRVQCGVCGIPSTGCDVVFAITLTAGGSPGLSAEVLFTENGGTAWGDTNVTTLAANEDPDAIACVGTLLVVISEDSESLHYATLSDILAGTEVWVEVSTGFVAGNGPLAMWSRDVRHTWIVGENGYVYFTADPTAGVVVQDAGTATTENLNDVHAFDNSQIVAVGANNAVIVSRNGGETWAPLTGPNPAVVLNAVWMHSAEEWFVGDAGGQLWYTRDGGTNWTEKTFPGSGAGEVRDIKFATPTVGYMAHDTAAPAGRLLRTIDGGHSWYVAPESNLTIPANGRINAVAPCEDNVNVVFAGGLGDDALDGFIVKGA